MIAVLKATVSTRHKTIAAKNFRLEAMQISQCRRWLTREFNKALAAAEKDEIIYASFAGQLQGPPYTIYTGGLTGLNGKIMRREGAYDQY